MRLGEEDSSWSELFMITRSGVDTKKSLLSSNVVISKLFNTRANYSIITSLA